MKKQIVTALLIAVLLPAGIFVWKLYQEYHKAASDDPVVWEDDIKQFEHSDSKSMPGKGQILFVGSSSFRMWKSLEKDMSPLPVINRGFGGAKLPDLIHYADRIIFPYEPSMVVIYCGDNDMGVGRIQPVSEVTNNVIALTTLIIKKLPRVKIYYVSIKPSPTRLKRWKNMNRANREIKKYMDSHSNMTFIDVSSSMFTNDKLNKELFIWDGIHMNEKGYALWTRIIQPLLARDYNSRKKLQVNPVDINRLP